MKSSERELRHCKRNGTGSPNELVPIAGPRNNRRLRSLASFIGRYAAKIGLSERRKDVRVIAAELNVNYASGMEEKPTRIKDISLTGAYLFTDHRWQVGTTLRLTLQSRSRRSSDALPRVRLQAKVVRLARDGVGVSFEHEYIDTAQWCMLTSKAASLFPEYGVVRVFRMAKMLEFLHRVSPCSESHISNLFKEELSDERIEKALDIVLRAEGMIDSRKIGRKSEMDPSLVLQILLNGSKCNEEPVQECWSGLLVAAYLEGSNIRNDLSFAALLSKLEAIHLLILTNAGQKAFQAGFQPGTAAPPIYCTMDQIKQITQTRNVAVIECALNRLYDFGLMELTIKPFGCASLDHVNLTPTSLGMAFYRACSGQQVLQRSIDSKKIEMAS
jgi:hypothetical protein